MCLPKKHCWFIILYMISTRNVEFTRHHLLHHCSIRYIFIYIPFLWRKPAKRPQNKISTITKASEPHFLECNTFCIKASLASTCTLNYQLTKFTKVVWKGLRSDIIAPRTPPNKKKRKKRKPVVTNLGMLEKMRRREIERKDEFGCQRHTGNPVLIFHYSLPMAMKTNNGCSCSSMKTEWDIKDLFFTYCCMVKGDLLLGQRSSGWAIKV